MASERFYALYAAMGGLYIQWTAASILSLKNQGKWQGGIGVVVESEIEKNILKKIFPEIDVWVANVKLDENVPKYLFKPYALATIPQEDLIEKDNILFLDCDVLFKSDCNEFLKLINQKFWVEKIYSKDKALRYANALIDCMKLENIELEEKYFEYNSGCWSVPGQNFYSLCQDWARFNRKYFLKGPVAFWTDQVFFAPAAVNNNLIFQAVPGFYTEEGYTTILHGEEKGFIHISGDWRIDKLLWTESINKLGISKNLKKLAKDKLSKENYNYLYESKFSRDKMLGKNHFTFFQSLKRNFKNKKLKYKTYLKTKAKFILKG